MVCLGNICRSPLAEGILKEKVRRRGLSWQVDSAGTGYWHTGEGPDPRSVAIAKMNGIDISGQRARQVRPADLEAFDLIFAMDTENYRDLCNMATGPGLEQKIHLIMDMVHPGKRQSVPDPYYDDAGFAGVFRMIDQACERIVEKWHGK